jgi:hypothetical protein
MSPLAISSLRIAVNFPFLWGGAAYGCVYLFICWGPAGYGLASTSHLAMSNVGIGCNFPLLVEADVEVELNKLRSVQLQLQLQRQGFPIWGGDGYGRASCSPFAGLEAYGLA